MKLKPRHLFITGAGVAFIGWGVFSRYDTQKFIENAATVDGTIVEVTSYRKKKSRQMIYEPIVEFETARGEVLLFKGPESDEGGYAVGDAVEVLYEVDDPEGARLNTFNGVWGSTILILIFGPFFVLRGLIAAIFTKA